MTVNSEGERFEALLAQEPEPVRLMVEGARQIVEACEELCPMPDTPLSHLGSGMREALQRFRLDLMESYREEATG